MAVQQRVSASTQNQALSALLFLYRHVLGMEVGAIEEVPRARVPARVPVVLSRDEVGVVLKHVTGKVWMIVVLALDRKYPNAPTDWAWQFVCPAARIYRDPQFGPLEDG